MSDEGNVVTLDAILNECAEAANDSFANTGGAKDLPPNGDYVVSLGDFAPGKKELQSGDVVPNHRIPCTMIDAPDEVMASHANFTMWFFGKDFRANDTLRALATLLDENYDPSNKDYGTCVRAVAENCSGQTVSITIKDSPKGDYRNAYVDVNDVITA